MKLTVNKKAYQTRGITGFVGCLLMIPAFILMMIAVFAILLLAAPGFIIARIGAVRTPHLDEK
tara:strand:+ start:146 stop:334 length:189 start_codon:yes stop_codon:yes gene_type:complete